VKSPTLLVAVVSLALVLTMTGFMPVAAVLPALFAEWGLSETQAGWLNGIFFTGYALGVLPLLPLTDRVDPRRVLLFSFLLSAAGGFGFAFLADGLWSGMAFRFLAGIGLSGVHFPGMKLLTDRLDGRMRVRGSAIYISMFSFGGAMSFLGAGLIEAWFGWRWVFWLSGYGALASMLLVFLAIPPVAARGHDGATALLDFRPVFRNRDAMRYVIAYFGHVWEVFAFRIWSVALLVYSAAQPGNEAFAGWNMAAVSGVASLLMMPTSVGVGELASRFGRVRVVTVLTVLTVGLALALGIVGAASFPVIVALMVLYFMIAFGDTAALAGGVVQAAEPRYRGATLAVYALTGFLGGTVGPVVFGFVLDLAGGRSSAQAWPWAFASLAIGAAITAAALNLRRGGARGSRGA
jgi:MFS family permease